MNVVKTIDRLLDGITMYRLVLYYLLVLIGIAALLSAFRPFGFGPFALLVSATYLVVVCVGSNTLLGRILKAPINFESSYITALILAVIITPQISPSGVLFLTVAGVLAMASKYIVAVYKKHLFNPAAFAVVLTSISIGQSASWWVGSTYLLPIVIIGGLLVVRKMRRMRMVLVFLLFATASSVGAGLVAGQNAFSSISFLPQSALFFMGTIMLTEPQTTPPTAGKRYWYAALIGSLFSPQVHVLHVYATPELALTIGNLFSFIVSPKIRLLTTLRLKTKLSDDIMEFTFRRDPRFTYEAGQYAEITLPHPHGDQRGGRRYFTIASSPTEANLLLATKFYPHCSTFKRSLRTLNDHSPIAIGQPAGEFTLPKDARQKIVFIAGGIGITPYRSMMQYLLDTHQKRTITLLYSEMHSSQFAFSDVFTKAQKEMDTKLVYVVRRGNKSWGGRTGYITGELVKEAVPDFAERLFYISGSLPMVLSVYDALRGLKISRSHIKTDYFSGYT